MPKINYKVSINFLLEVNEEFCLILWPLIETSHYSVMKLVDLVKPENSNTFEINNEYSVKHRSGLIYVRLKYIGNEHECNSLLRSIHIFQTKTFENSPYVMKHQEKNAKSKKDLIKEIIFQKRKIMNLESQIKTLRKIVNELKENNDSFDSDKTLVCNDLLT